MVNHVRTLLLNESAPHVSAWFVDPSFSRITLSGELARFQDALFAYAPDRGDRDARARAVSSVMPFMRQPDIRVICAGTLDERSTVAEDCGIGPLSSTVALFYASSALAGGIRAPVSQCLSCVEGVLTLFSVPKGSIFDGDPDGNTPAGVLPRLRSAYDLSGDEARKFAACLWAYVMRLEILRLAETASVR